MLKITEAGMEGTPVDRFSRIKSRPLIGKIALRFTRWRRAVNVEKYIGTGETHLDIGCGDGYFLFRSPYKVRYGLDKLMGEGDEITSRLDFPDNSMDLVTMLAVIEHFKNPEHILREIHRVLKPGGKLVLTTPKKSAEWLINLYVRDIDHIHEMYFDPDSMKKMTDGLFEMAGYHTFIMGLNQAYYFTKPAA